MRGDKKRIFDGLKKWVLVRNKEHVEQNKMGTEDSYSKNHDTVIAILRWSSIFAFFQIVRR